MLIKYKANMASELATRVNKIVNEIFADFNGYTVFYGSKKWCCQNKTKQNIKNC